MKSEKLVRIMLLILVDATLCVLSVVFASIMFGADWILLGSKFYIFIITVVIVTIIVNSAFRMYNSIWIGLGIKDLFRISLAVLVANIIIYSINYFTHSGVYIRIHLLYLIFSMASMLSVRMFYHFSGNRRQLYRGEVRDEKKVLIVGAGEFGSMILKELLRNPAFGYPVSIVDDDKNKHGSYLRGVKVEGDRDDIPRICREKSINEIIVAIPSASEKQIAEIANICAKTTCKVKIVPSLLESIIGNQHISYKNVRDIELVDLLGRKPKSINYKNLVSYIRRKCVVVTGGGGSIGSELCRIIASMNPVRLVIIDNYENTAHDLKIELLSKHPHLDVFIALASVRDAKRIDSIIAMEKPDIIFHAAAHKHVPICENNKGEAIRNNVFGTLNVARAADRHGVKRFVLISSDKAVNPTNIMGATKRICELIVKAFSGKSKTIFAAVRFGNVLGSNGSVVSLFKRQIEEGGPVTVTHPDIIRYFMLIPEAAMLVLQAAAKANGGEIFILDMGEPVKITDLAEKMIRLSGKEPGLEIEIKYTGLRPGEKLYEELLMKEERISTRLSDGIYIGNSEEVDFDKMMGMLANIEECLDNNAEEDAVHIVSELVPSYESEGSMKKHFL